MTIPMPVQVRYSFYHRGVPPHAPAGWDEFMRRPPEERIAASPIRPSARG